MQQIIVLFVTNLFLDVTKCCPTRNIYWFLEVTNYLKDFEFLTMTKSSHFVIHGIQLFSDDITYEIKVT